MKLNIAHVVLAFVLGIALSSGVLIENAHAGQPDMYAALDHLKAARHDLEIARHDKGGHREAAIGIIDNAIHEVRAGIDAGW